LEELGQAQKLYNAVRERARMQFFSCPGGVAPWLLCLLSQRRAQTDFLEEHIRKHGQDEGTCVISRAIWEVKPSGTYSGKTFCIVLGDLYRPSYILPEKEQPPHDAVCIYPPIEHKPDFESDLDEAIRNVAGRATAAASALFRDPSCINECVDDLCVHPFAGPGVILGTTMPLTLQETVVQEAMFQIQEGGKRPRLHPDAPRVMHVDLAATDCSAGMACVHMAMGPDTITPYIWLDFVLEIVPPPKNQGQIDYEKIVQFIIWLRNNGFVFAHVSFDQYQSQHSQIILNKAGIATKYISVDTTDEPYTNLRGLFQARRIRIYRHEKLLRELAQLEHDITVRKVFKPSIGSKDISDGLAGACYGLMPTKPKHGSKTQIVPTAVGPSILLPAAGEPE
jgi:hypothetical protein